MATALRPGVPTLVDLADFSGGLNTRDAPDELARNESGDLWNVTFDERGGVGSRLGFSKYNAAGQYRVAVLASSPLIYWRLDETSGTTFADSSGNGRAGTLEGAVSYAQPGALAGDTDTALGLGGGADVLNSAGSLSLTAGAYTIEAWVKRTTPGHRDAIFWMGDSTTGVGVYLYFDTDDKLKFALGSGAAGVGLSVVATSSVTTADTNWHHVAFSAAGRLYLDGVLVAAPGGSTAGVGSGTIIRAGAGGFALGTVALMTGTLDEIAVYGSTLSDATIIGHFQVGTAPTGSYSTTDIVKNGFAWDSAGHKVVQCGASVFLDTSVVAFKTFTTSARVAFADFLGSLYMLHPVDGLFVSDGTSGGTSSVVGAPRGTTLAVWQNQLWSAGDPAHPSRVSFTVPGDGAQWADAKTTTTGSHILPVATLNVVSTTGFDPAGALLVDVDGGQVTLAYTGVTATTFTGVTGGTGTKAAGTLVVQGQRFNDLREKDDTALVCLAGASGEDIAGRPGLLAFKKRSAYRINDAATGSYVTIDPAVGCASSIGAVSLLGRTYTISEAGIFWTDGNGPMRNEGDKLRPLWSDRQLAFDQIDLWCAGEKQSTLVFSVPLVGDTFNSLALEHFPAGKPENAATVLGSNAASCYFTSHAGEERLFGGSPVVAGQVYEHLSGGTDDGSPIHSWFQTPWYPLTPGYKTRLRSLVVEGRADALNLYTKRDFETGQGDLTILSISLSSWKWNDGTKWDDGHVWGPATLVGFSDRIPSLGCGRVFAFRFDATTTNTQELPPLIPLGTSPELGSWAVQALHFQAIPLSPI